MKIGTLVAIYFLIWWISLFAVLPWGVRNQEEAGADAAPGTDPGAPVMHRIGRKLIWTTVVATVVFSALYGAYTFDLIPYDFLMRISGPPH